MLSSLFGDLRSLRGHPTDPQREPDEGFAATAIFDREVHRPDGEVLLHTRPRDLVVTGSPAQAIRDHFATTRADLESATRMISLYDPTAVWASAVIKALSDASGQQVERLHLREQGTLRTLASIERATLDQRGDDSLRIYHADVRAPGRANAAIPLALMERSHMSAVIVGGMSPHQVDEMLITLREAVVQPNWRCPTLLFMLPPQAVWMANRIGMVDWPKPLRVQVLNESLTSASAVWNALLSLWRHVKTEPTWSAPAAPAESLGESFPIRIGETPPLDNPVIAATRPPAPLVPSGVGLPATAASGPPNGASTHPRVAERPVAYAAHRATRAATVHSLDMASAEHTLAALIGINGMLGCAVVDGDSGLALAQRFQQPDGESLELAAAASAQLLRAHRAAAPDLGLDDPLAEVMTSAGSRHLVMRMLSKHPALFLFAVLDKQRCNLALARYKLMEAEHGLV